MDLAQAVEAFARGFANTKSIASPYTASREGPLWVLQDEARTRRVPRRTEVVALRVSAAESAERIANLEIGRHVLCAINSIDASFDDVKRAHVGAGYRLISRQPLFVADLSEAIALASPDIERVRTLDLAARVAKVARSRQLLPTDLESENPARRLYAAIRDNKVVGWVSSVFATREANLVANLYVAPEHRGQGLGRALMSALLADDASSGVRWSVLLSTTAGARVYPGVGYRQIGLLQLYVPDRREGIHLYRSPCSSKAN